MDTAVYIDEERQRHYRIAAIMHIVYACFGLLFGSIGALALFGLSAIPELNDTGIHQTVILQILAYAAIGITLVTTLPGLIGGIGVLKKRPWARILLLIVSVFDLFAFPIGTAIGIYTLWALWEPVSWARQG